MPRNGEGVLSELLCRLGLAFGAFVCYNGENQCFLLEVSMDIITLRSGDYTVAINLTLGANCISLRNERYGAVILREPDYERGVDNPFLYGMPILFPVNRVSGAKFTFEGREYIFPVNEPDTGCHLHGMLHAEAFECVERSESHLVARYSATEEKPYGLFPHAFDVTRTYRLSENGFDQTVTVTNRSETNMPLLMGFHTTFRAAFTETSRPEDIRVYADLSEEFERNMANYLPTGRKPAFDEVGEALTAGTFCPFGRPTSKHYRAAAPYRMVLHDCGRDLSVVYENDEKLPFRLIYNANADEFICMEPQTSLANSPNSPFSREEAGFGFLQPSETRVFRSHICLMKGDRRKN